MKRLLLVASLAASTIACAPGLGTKLDIPSIPPMASSNQQEDGVVQSWGEFRVRVDQFSDARGIAPLVRIDGREVTTDSNVGALVQAALQDGAREFGGKPCISNCPSIRGELTKWTAVVDPGFPATKGKAEAEIRIEILNGQGKVVHRGNYRGKVSTEHPLYSEEKVVGDLGNALNEAIKSFFTDEAVRNWLITG